MTKDNLAWPIVLNSNRACLICNSRKLETSAPPAKHNFMTVPTSLSNQLRVYFILKQVLELPSELVESVLSQFPNDLEGKWLSICEKCNQSFVEMCTATFLELLSSKRKFMRAKIQLLEAIKRSTLTEEDEAMTSKEVDSNESNNKQGTSDLCKEARRFVMMNDYAHLSGTNPFIAGDLMANQRLLEQEKMTQNMEFCSLSDSPEPDQVHSSSCFIIKIIADQESRKLPQKDLCDGYNDAMIKEEPGSPISNIGSDSSGESADVQTVEPNVKEENPGFCDENEGHHDVCSVEENGSTGNGCVTNKHSNMESSDSSVSRQVPIAKKRHGELIVSSGSSCWKPFKCDLCPEAYKTQTSLQEHQISEHNINHYACNECDWKGSTECHLKWHLRGSHGIAKDLEVEVRCPICNKVMTSEDHLKFHLRKTHQPKDQEKFQCELCGKEYRNKDTFVAHMGSTHGIKDAHRFYCSFKRCRKSFSSHKSLKKHEKLHQNPQHICDTCGKGFHEASNLRFHVESMHLNREPFLCDLCPKQFKKKEYLKNHLKTAHNSNGLMTFEQVQERSGQSEKTEVTPCPQCGALFRKTVLQAHITRVHKKREHRTAFICNVCGKILSTDLALKLHRRKEHQFEPGCKQPSSS